MTWRRHLAARPHHAYPVTGHMPAITRAILRRCCTDVRQDGDIVTSMTCSLPNTRRPPMDEISVAGRAE